MIRCGSAAPLAVLLFGCMELPKDAPPLALAGAAGGTPEPAASSTTTPAPSPTIEPGPNRPELPPLFGGAVTHAERALPIAGGSLVVTRDGTTALAADADRDSVFVVELATRDVRTIATALGEAPGRIVEGPPGTAFVAARRGGTVLALDLASATVSERFTPCSEPRGLAYDGERGVLHVACRSGALVTLDAASGAVVKKLALDHDLRDVIVYGDELIVTRWKDAEVLVVASDGGVVRRGFPAVGARPSVAFRAGFHAPSGMMLLAHQVESGASLGSGFGAYYGSDCGGGVVQHLLTSFAVDGRRLGAPAADDTDAGAEEPALGIDSRSSELFSFAGPLDLAFSPDGTRLAVVSSGNAWSAGLVRPTLFVTAVGDSDGMPVDGVGTPDCPTRLRSSPATSLPEPRTSSEPVAVAFDGGGNVIVQSREPAQLEFEDGTIIPLSDQSHADTGLALFHMNSAGGIACASCHPEGHEDGHTWLFAEFGQRRSQSLQGGASSRAPFHWAGDLATFHDLVAEVMMGRMALPAQVSEEQEAALLSFLDALPPIPPVEGLDAAAVERGRALFFDRRIGCDRCHAGADYSDNRPYDVGTGETLITPSLVGVSHRLPLMHDGCATTLRARFGACGGDERHNPPLAEAEIDDLTEFLRSL